MSQEMLALSAVTPIHRLREDREFYIPDYLSAGPAGIRSEAWSAAEQQATELRDAERHLDDAINLVAVLRASLQEAADARAMQAETVLKIAASRLKKVHTCLDRHDRRFTNLCVAYFDLSDRVGSSRDD